MKSFELKATVLKEILRAMKEAKRQGVDEPLQVVMDLLKASINWESFKGRYNLK